MRFHSRRISARLAVLLLFGSSFAWLVLASGPDAAPQKKAAQEFYYHHDHIIGTSLDLSLIAPNEAAAQAAEQAILGEIERLRRVFSTYDNDSELSRLNRTREPLAASADLLAVLRHYELFQQRSGGAFNGQLGELVRVWKEAEKANREPDAATLQRIAEKVRQPGWRIDDAGGTVTRLTDQPLNLNAIAKGYIIEKAAAAARARVPVLKGLLMNLGGDLAVWGCEESGRPGWTIGVQDPEHPEDNATPLTVLRVHDRAVATSGGYERYYTINGRRYSHLFDPRTGRPADGNLSATVIARDNVTANALATTLCILTPDEGLRLAAAMGVECLLVTKEGKEMRSAGWPTDAASRERQRPENVSLSPVADAPGSPLQPVSLQDKKADVWPAGYQVNLTLTLPYVNSGKYRKPYVAVWIENADAKPVRMITVWGGASYWKDLPMWWKFARNDQKVANAISRATRSPGKYQLVWDGKDDRGAMLPQGKYTVYVEVHREFGRLVRQSGAIVCGAEPAQITLAKNAETEATLVEYAKKK